MVWHVVPAPGGPQTECDAPTPPTPQSGRPRLRSVRMAVSMRRRKLSLSLRGRYVVVSLRQPRGRRGWPGRCGADGRHLPVTAACRIAEKGR